MNKPYDIDLEQRLAYLEQANFFKMKALDLARELGDFNSSISQLKNPDKIFEKCQAKAGQIIGFRQMAFFLVNERDSSFNLYRIYPEISDSSAIEAEVDILVEDGTFSRAILEREPVTAYARGFEQQLLLHVLATPSRVRGMFVGVLEKKARHIQEAAFELFSILMSHCANALESFELYQQLKESNIQLQKKVNQLSQSQSCLKDEILEHEKTEAALEASERQYRLLAETAREMILIISKDKKIQYANSSALTTCGYENVDMNGLSIFQLIEAFDALVAENGQEDSMAQIVDVRSRSGQKIPLEINIAPIPQKEGAFGYLLVGRDISRKLKEQEERKKLEVKLWQARKMESIGLLASGIAHDFNNILSVISNYTALSIASTQTNEPIFDYLKKVQKASDRAIHLARKLYTIGRRDDQKKVDINVVAVVKDTIDLMKSSLGKAISVTFWFDEDKMMIKAEETGIQQVLMNLITNAGHALKDQNGHIHIQVSRAEFKTSVPMSVMTLMPGKYIQISVKDDGPGIDPEIVSQVFDPYFSTKTGKDNSGLGLSVVHGIVKNHRGGIDIQTTVGSGSCFDVYLPEDGD